MGNYKRKSHEIEAYQWFANGDHPQDESEFVRGNIDPTKTASQNMTEGKVVKRYCRNFKIQDVCKSCGRPLVDHGGLPIGGNRFLVQKVCPGDYVVTGSNGTHYAMKPEELNAYYEEVKA